MHIIYLLYYCYEHNDRKDTIINELKKVQEKIKFTVHVNKKSSYSTVITQ